MKQKIDQLNRYFEEQISLCRQKEQALREDARQDEGTFEKIRANIFDIFRTVLSAGVKAHPDDPDALKAFFLQRLQQIPSGWKASYEKASQHGNTAQMAIEEIKLKALSEIQQTFAGIWEA